MQSNSIEMSFLSLFTLLSFFIFLAIQKFTSSSDSLFLDKDFKKPQSFHKIPISRSGGLAAIISLSIFLLMYYFFFSKILFDYLIIGLGMFFLGFIDDIKINISPNIRLLFMIIIISICSFIFSIRLNSVDLFFLEFLLNNNIFHIFFILLCFLFIINGSNLIDGFNGLLTIHLLIINSVLLFINLKADNSDFAILILGQIIILICFLLFNFPKAKIFLGDSGSYLFGSLVTLNIIETNNLNPNISSFFFCIILFYLFFEVFFSFFRKIYLKKSPLKPDANHLHMLSYRYLNSLNKFKDCNYINSIFINLFYIAGILPSIYFMGNGIFCRYWFFCLLVLYIVFYSRIYSFTKK